MTWFRFYNTITIDFIFYKIDEKNIKAKITIYQNILLKKLDKNAKLKNSWDN